MKTDTSGNIETMKNLIKRELMSYLVRKNEDELFSPIKSFEFEGKTPTLHLTNGLVLASKAKRVSELNSSFPQVPRSHHGLFIEYFLRYCYPHYDPSLIPDCGIIPTSIQKKLLHPQHLNGFNMLGNHQLEELLVEQFKIREEDVVLELGSFISFGTMKMSLSAKRVIAVEANTEFHENAKKNISASKITNVDLLNAAVGDEDLALGRFWIGKNQANSLLKDERTDFVEIPVCRPESIMTKFHFEPTIVVLTLNGVELNVLRSMQSFLSQARDIRIICPGWYSDSEGKYGPRIISLLHDLNFRVEHTKNFHIFAFK